MAKEETFEESLNKLEKIVQQLERGEAPLEAAVEQFQKGIKLSGDLQQKLELAEKTLTKVIGEAGKEENFDRDSDDDGK
ncbi:exodeoxyribonuclease VII small subunit [Liquorilactobacillus oeni]|uniref:Exodeoxyribonuclease 7 small subunit n=1 Tax=Liquorilactobacillus oeni DSM 19972 TaxID=1423777 RepID=A0A0R1M7Y5_9LACO|nr:exodeoxyribonuclease VII small subunit [Liquorilactobacillus oeni]KRL04254.1 hypothetical protein FD46_GL001378 [Liquorilactobacillus oeni DSM 19972]